ncbi:MAG TPA: hypothetical protein VFN56_04315 [Candidatus Saccharimonadales bacterium]|nr:hypothetical protein [Candidatus Saccharimonadales bacterium]
MNLRFSKHALSRGITAIKTKTALIAGVLGIVLGGTGSVAFLTATASAAQNYTLFGSATSQSNGVSLVSANSTDFSGITLALPSNTTVGSLSSVAATFQVNSGSCGGGSPRFSVVTPAGTIFVYIGDAPSFASCSSGSTGNLLATTDMRIDSSQVSGGRYGDTWAHVQSIAGSQPISEMDIVVDGGWSAPQDFTFSSASVNTTAYTFTPRPTLNWGAHLNAAQCVGKVGGPVVNVTEKITNDADSGIAGNYWAFDNVNRQIQVWHVGSAKSTNYCAVVRYEGSFQTIAGQTSPGATTTLSGNVSGTIAGGYIATFSSTSPVSTKGHVGTIDYACDATGYCRHYVDWVSQYFGSTYTNFNQPWWGWIYTGNNGSVWVNSIEGNAGDITG